MIKISDKTNLLESVCELVPDYDLPNYHRDIYPYTEVPKVVFDGKYVEMAMPKEILITDTTFRDGQQAVEPYTDEQIVKIYALLSKLSPFALPCTFTEPLTSTTPSTLTVPVIS